MKADTTSAVGLAEAQALIVSTPRVLAAEQVALADALGRVLRQDAVSDVDLPPSDVSLVDGFCLESSSTTGASDSRPVRLRLSGTLRAGGEASGGVGPGECLAIMTGAALPAGADAVVRTEDASEVEGWVLVTTAVEPGTWVSKRALFIRRGDPARLVGRRASPPCLGLLGGLGVDPVLVARRPLVGVIATGDELLPVKSRPGAGALRASNLPMLAGLARQLGCDVLDCGISGDDQEAIVAQLDRCGECDAVVISGGASRGRFDLTAAALRTRGVRPIFTEVRLRPARRAFFGVDGDRVFFSLPGTPAAALVAFHLFVRPALLTSMGARSPVGNLVRARVACRLEKGADYSKVLLAGWVLEGGRTRVRPIEARGGGDLPRLSEATCIIVLGEGLISVEAGDEVDVLALEEGLGAEIDGGSDQHD